MTDSRDSPFSEAFVRSVNERVRPSGFVYFISPVDDLKRIKIGIAADVPTRVRQLEVTAANSTGLWLQLEVLHIHQTDHPRDDEAAIHRELQVYRRIGSAGLLPREWFRDVRAIRRLIYRLKRGDDLGAALCEVRVMAKSAFEMAARRWVKKYEKSSHGNGTRGAEPNS